MKKRKTADPAALGDLHVRNLKFDLRDDVPRVWHGKGKAATTFFNNLSIFFPAGERFFVRSVKRHLKFVTDETLRKEVMAFCGQEGVHSREHERYNQWLQDQGYPIGKMDARVDRLLRFFESFMPARSMLAATCALEHFTALMGDILLSDTTILENSHPTMKALWSWHAVEENEHKAVAFDVYQQAGGTYAERVGIMILATLIFWAKVVEQNARLMHKDGTLGSAIEWREFSRILFVDPALMVKLAKPYLDYFRPGFHPWDKDNTELIEEWKRHFEASADYPQAA